MARAIRDETPEAEYPSRCECGAEHITRGQPGTVFICRICQRPMVRGTAGVCRLFAPGDLGLLSEEQQAEFIWSLVALGLSHINRMEAIE